MASASWPRVAVVGAGAVGGYFGGMLARAGAEVMLIGRPAHVDVWARDGLTIDGVNVQEVIAVRASTDVSAAGDADLVLFCVKSLDTDSTARELARHLRTGATVVSLQNGVDNVPRMRDAGLDPIAAVVYVASSMPEAGRVKHAGRGDLIIGDLRGRDAAPRDGTLNQVAAWFEAAGVPCRVSPNVEADLWTKLITNVGLNALSAVVNLPYGALVTTPESRETIRQLVEECVAVGRADGVALPSNDFVDMVIRFAEHVPRVFSSTAQDLNRGKHTEIDALNGLIVRRGAVLGVPTPVNQALLALVKLREVQRGG
jgi:2-dehydropantoate 2-reductase